MYGVEVGGQDELNSPFSSRQQTFHVLQTTILSDLKY